MASKARSKWRWDSATLNPLMYYTDIWFSIQLIATVFCSFLSPCPFLLVYLCFSSDPYLSLIRLIYIKTRFLTPTFWRLLNVWYPKGVALIMYINIAAHFIVCNRISWKKWLNPDVLLYAFYKNKMKWRLLMIAQTSKLFSLISGILEVTFGSAWNANMLISLPSVPRWVFSRYCRPPWKFCLLR